MIKAKALSIYKEEKISLVKLAKRLKLDRATVTKWVRESGMHIKIDGKNLINTHTFEKIDTEEKAYWLGFLFADGNVSKNNIDISLSLKDTAHLEKFKDFMKWEGDIKIDNKGRRCRICFGDKIMAKDLIKLGCTEKKSLTLQFPTEEQVPKHLIYHFIRGYFDGDGYVSDPENIKTNFQLSFTGTTQFLTSILEIFLFDPLLYVKKVKHAPKICYFQLTGKNARMFLKCLYDDATTFLDRKKERYEKGVLRWYKNKNGIKCLS